jgi:type I restriction enzyme S subunit
LAEIRIEIPEAQVQSKEVEQLVAQTAKIDTLIGETERFIELSRERRSALITAAVTGEIDVRGEAA